MIEVFHVTFSQSGGAGKIATRLAKAQEEIGLSTEVISLTDKDVRGSWYRLPFLTLTALVDFFIVRKKGSKNLFTLYRRTMRKQISNKFNFSDKVVHLHWYGGLFRPEDLDLIFNRTRKVVITLHDMWPITGGCHFSDDCTLYRTSCTGCPQVKKPFRNTVSTTFRQKHESFQRTKNLVFTSPGLWLCEDLKQSNIGRQLDIVHILNPVDEGFFVGRGPNSDKNAGVDIKRSFIIGFCANDVSEPRKNFKGAYESFLSVRELYFEKIEVKFHVVGRFDKDYLKEYPLAKFLGKMKTQSDLVEAYQQFDILLSLSKAETYPNVVHECAAMGVPSVLSRINAHSHASGNFAITVDSAEKAVDAIDQLMKDHNMYLDLQMKCKSYVEQIKMEVIAKQYIDLYQ
jgi:glycosyltransferase involved in cell wall biosynthesis